MGPIELLTVLLVALVVLGPKRMVDVARTLARFTREIRKVTSDITRTLEDEPPPRRGPSEERGPQG